jgi:hypothetical protein
LPTPFDGTSCDTQKLGSIVLGETFVKEQVGNLLFVLGQLFDLFVKLCPASDIIWFLGSIMQFSASVIRRLRIGMVIGCESFWSEVMSGQIKEFSADLERGEVEEMSDGFDLDVCQSAMEPDHSVLKDIIGLFPSSKAWIGAKHLSGKTQEAIAGMVEKSIMCRWFSLEVQVDESLELGVGIGSHRRFPKGKDTVIL